ncbi:hypothetical protein [Faecalibacter macacae]|uniref:DUF4279 domain-containing protein n=1 Tax=Faecalibacter macacae TaxID=1859289 RepID=A0A3L9M1L2_9FLAO|nr:hypothetical protein [Faecalibacter macacae]RLZ06413.1 hypothetical protein EAH69_13605 [Faecalibacter macacae]
MCILEIYSDTDSFKEFIKTTTLPNFKIDEKGEFTNSLKKRLNENYIISIKISNKEMDNLNGQINDAIQFLNINCIELEKLVSNHKVTFSYLRFGVLINENQAILRNYYPIELLRLVNRLNFEIETAIYNGNSFE